MNKLLTGLAAVPLLSSVAFAGQPLTDQQMDKVTAGQGIILSEAFSAFSTSEAEAYGGVTGTQTGNLATLSKFGAITVEGTTSPLVLTIIKSVSAAYSLSTASNLPAGEAP
jgi:hypothetical protein